MDIPVYLVAGFLDAGKTNFINGILEDGFAREDKTLLLCCEEGEEEYEKKALANVTVVTVDDEDELTAAFCRALEKKCREKIAYIAHLLETVAPYEQERVGKVKERITDALEKTLSVDYDKNRLEQELIYYIEKLDINEEKQRLSNHLKYFISTLESGSGQGKKLGFIAQEMGREINTLGSKSNHAEMQKIVVQMKDELEQIKEQVLNVM